MSKFIGLMSGTSVDGIDAALVEFGPQGLQLLATHSTPIPAVLRDDIFTLFSPGADEIEKLGRLDRQLGRLFAQAALDLLRCSGIAAEEVTAIGSHGQTIRHRPRLADETAFSLQIGDPNTIAELTGITTVADFRRRDIACHGQGAPLTPAFHQAFFAHPSQNRCVLNLGGIANITYLPIAGQVIGFDTGPANGLMDYWVARCRSEPFDKEGAWAASGKVHEPLLARFLEHSFFALSPPKSTGKEEFTPLWLHAMLQEFGPLANADVQATLLELTASSIATAIIQSCPDSEEIFLCGGGARNNQLVKQLAARLPGCRISTTQALGVDVNWVEPIAFAWLAMRRLAGLSGNLPAVTGAIEERCLGSIYPGR